MIQIQNLDYGGQTQPSQDWQNGTSSQESGS
jgi:hypothetical protein